MEIELAIVEAAARLGYSDLKLEQKDVLRHFVNGNDVFVCLPTGFGKSLCYCCLPMLYDLLDGRSSPWSTIIVISPLVALMSDQVRSLNDKGISSIKIVSKRAENYSGCNSGDHSDDDLRSSVMNGRYQIIFTNPELLLTDKDWSDVFQSSTFCSRLVGLIVDEAHCVKKWGATFRKEFSKLGDLRGFFPSSLSVMALTATASLSTRKEVMKLLGMLKPITIMKSPDKVNIVYKVSYKNEEMEEEFLPLIEELRVKRSLMDRTIIFCRRYTETSYLYLLFKSKLGKEMVQPVGSPDIPKFRLCDMFTACNSPQVKNSILKLFTSHGSRLRVVIATIAFGMGIDCSDVRRIIHWGPPSDVESYIQETGRAGRDGQTAEVTLFYNKTDLSFGYMEDSITSYCLNSDKCRREVLFKDFGTLPNKPTGCMCCDICC